MKTIFSRAALLLAVLLACKAEPLFAASMRPKAFVPKAGIAALANVPLQYLDTSLMVTYTPVAQQAGGTWQLLLLAPDGALYQDERHERIDVLNPIDPTKGITAPFHFKLSGPMPVGVYTLIVYMKERDNSLPVNMRALAQDVSIFLGDRRMLVTQPADFFSGNTAATEAGESAQLFFAVADPKHQLAHPHKKKRHSH